MSPAPQTCVIAFREPPSHWGFTKAKSGKCWWIRLDPARVERCLQVLRFRNIAAIVSNLPPATANIIRIKPGGRGKHARIRKTAHRDHLAELKAIQIYEAGVLAGRKMARVNREANKRAAELASQKRKRLLAEAFERADAVVASARPN